MNTIKQIIVCSNLFFILFLSQCDFNNHEKKSKWEIRNTQILSKKINLSIDTIFLNHPNSSFQGFFEMDNNKILFFDNLFASVGVFDINGNFISTYLGKGQGPKDCQGINSWVKNGNTNLIFRGFAIYKYTNEWERYKTLVLNTIPTISKLDLENNPKPDYIDIYEVKYFHNHHSMLDSTYVLFNIESTHPKFNGYFSNVSKEYYKNANILAKVNIKNGRWIENKGHYSDYYFTHPNIPNFANWSYDYDGNNIYLNFEADSLIYVFDKNVKPLFAFGLKGNNMNQNYIQTKNYDDAMKIFHVERERKGFYSDIKHIKDKDLTFRCYTIGNKSIQSLEDEYNNIRRMQIYKHEKLVADIKVPKRFRIIGYDSTFIYADGIVNTVEEKLAFYRFKIPNL